VRGEFGLGQPEHGGEISFDEDARGLAGRAWVGDHAMDQRSSGVHRLGLLALGEALVQLTLSGAVGGTDLGHRPNGGGFGVGEGSNQSVALCFKAGKLCLQGLAT
jgi:hypothetical protein